MNDQPQAPPYAFNLFQMPPNPIGWVTDESMFHAGIIKLLERFNEDKKTRPGLTMIYLFFPCPGCTKMAEPHVQPLYSYAQFEDEAHKQAFVGVMRSLALSKGAIASLVLIDAYMAQYTPGTREDSPRPRDHPDRVSITSVVTEHVTKKTGTVFTIRDDQPLPSKLDDGGDLEPNGSLFSGFVSRGDAPGFVDAGGAPIPPDHIQ